MKTVSHRVLSLMALGYVLAYPAIAAAQVNPPQIKDADKPPIAYMYLALLVIIALVIGANMIPSKRGHQD